MMLINEGWQRVEMSEDTEKLLNALADIIELKDYIVKDEHRMLSSTRIRLIELIESLVEVNS